MPANAKVRPALRPLHGRHSGAPVGDIASAIGEKFGAPTPIEQAVSDVIAELGEWAAGLAFDLTMDAPFTRESLGWVPSRTGIVASI